MLEKIFIKEDDYYNYIKKAFAHIAPFYDIFNLFVNRLRQKAINVSGVTFGDRVIDFCTGTGALALKLVDFTPNVMGVDLCYEMLKIASRKDRERRIKFIQMDATKTYFEDNEFDISFICFGLHDMPQEIREKTLEEMKRVTKKKIIVIDYFVPKNLLIKWVYIFLISIYETKYFRDFAKRDLEEELSKQGLKILSKHSGVWDFFRIFVCSK